MHINYDNKFLSSKRGKGYQKRLGNFKMLNNTCNDHPPIPHLATTRTAPNVHTCDVYVLSPNVSCINKLCDLNFTIALFEKFSFRIKNAEDGK